MKKILSLFTALILFGSMTVQADYYVAGTFNSWNPGDAGYKMSGSGPYSMTKQLNSGAYEFKITNGSWGWSTNSYDQSASNVTLSISDGNIKFSLSTTSDVTFYYSTSSNKAYVQATPVVVPSYTFPSGTTIYYDFTAYGGGVNVCINGSEPWHSSTTAIFSETLSSAWEVTASTNLFKSAPNSWSYKTCSTLPTEGQNMLVGDADGIGCHWDTYSGGMPEPTPATIKLHGDFTGSWANTDAFVIAGNEETASLALTIPAKGMKSFGVRIGSDDNWTSNGAAITRGNAAAVITSGDGNCSLNADIPGEYIFTWTYASNTLSVTYPGLPSQFVEFDGLASQILKGTEVTFAANSSGINNPVYSYFVKPEGGEYGSAVAAYTFNAEGNFVVKVSAEGDNTAAPVIAEENVSVYDAHTFTSGTTIFVDFSAVSGDAKGVNYPSTDAAYAGSYDAAGAGTVKTVTFSTNVTWTTNDVFIKTEKAGWDPGMKFTVPGDGQNCAVVAADGASFTWSTHTAPVVTVEAKGEWDGWTDALAFVPDVSGLTATATLAGLPAGNYAFKLIVDGNWLSNENAFHRFWTSASGITENLDNMELQADADGDYIFTWTFATNAIEITFPSTPKTGTNEVKFFAPRTEEHPWDNVYVYAWRRTAGDDEPLLGAWPGALATKDGEWYKATVDKGACVIFHDNADMQSFDIENVQKDACYVANAIDNSEHEADPEKPIKAKFYESCTVNFFLTGDEGIMGAGNAWKENLPERQLNGSNSITLSNLPAGIYEFKLTNGSWAWSLGGQEHLNSACSSAAVTSGNGNVKFKIESAQDVTIGYDPATQKICLDAETVLPFENVRTGMTADNYYTVCFNREMKQIRGASLWSFIGRDAEFAYIVQESAPFAAGKPFIVFAESEKLEAVLDAEVSAPVANGALHGTFSLLGQADLDGKGDNIYLVIENVLRRVDSQTGNTLPAYRAYVDLDEIDPISTPNPAPGKNVRSMPMHKDATQGFENIETSDKPVKVMIDGTLYILRDGKVYDATGRMVK